MQNNIRDILIDIILKVAMQHHDDISSSDEDAACDAADEILEQYPQLTFPLIPENQDGPCYYCGEMTDSLIGNPSRWPIMLPHKDEPGKAKHHHMGCVMQRLEEINVNKVKELTESIFRGMCVPLYPKDKPINEMTSTEQGMYRNTYGIVYMVVQLIRGIEIDATDIIQ